MNKTVLQLQKAMGYILFDKPKQVNLALACLFAQGHLLIEDLPGMGKTTLAHGLAKVLGLTYDRVQFTSDMLPSDILGVSVFDQTQHVFTFHEGPVFSQLLLADEINRATPKTQSALLEAMEEKQVSIDGKTRALPSPFFVIATQNPQSQIGTFALPESQLDRFLLRVSLGYPSKQAEQQLFRGLNPRANIKKLKPIVSLKELSEIQAQVQAIEVSDHFLDYLYRLVDFSRTTDQFTYGISPRGALALLASAKAWAFIVGRKYATPEDIQAVLESVVGHRLHATGSEATNASAYLMQHVNVISQEPL